MKKIADMNDKELQEEIDKTKWVLNLAAQSSLQASMGYGDNCTYNRHMSLLAEQKKREEQGELYQDLMDMFSSRTHHRLIINAKNPNTEILIGDTKGNLVQKGIGKIDTSLATGYYDVHFTETKVQKRIRVSCAQEINE